MNTRQRAVLVGLLTDRDAILRRGDRPGIQHHEWLDATQGLVRLNAAVWLGRAPTSSDSTMNCRAFKAMEAAGFIERVAMGGGGVVTTHLRLLPAGEIAAGHLIDVEGGADA